MKKIILLLTSTLISVCLFAQKSDNVVEERSHEFGIHAGATTGVGLSYRYWPGKLGLQVTMLPIKTSDEEFYSLGVTGLYNFYNTRHIRFFGYLGNNLTIDNYSTYDYYESNEKNSYNTEYNIGFGPGFGFGTRVRINIMAGYGFYDILGEFNILPTAEIGLYFRL